jgi:lysylphosphatidylglycerol synthetase-like protein (DUF2156 family)
LKNPDSIPKPIIYCLIFIGIGITSAILGIINPFTIIGTFPLEGISAILYSSIIGIILSICTYGILKKRRWSLKITTTWYSLNIIILFFNFIVFIRNIKDIIKLKQVHYPENAHLYTDSNVSLIAFITFLLGIIFALYVIINLNRNKDYFIK